MSQLMLEVESNVNLVASPFNYVGGKYKILNQILPFFPKNIDKFVDLFAGGFNVGVNADAGLIYANDKNHFIIELLEHIYFSDIGEMIHEIHAIINEYQLTKTNKDGFLKLRYDYNNSNDKHPVMLYVLICYSYNYQFRFNSIYEYNNPFGRERSSFSKTLEQKLVAFSKKIKYKNVIFKSNDFELLLDELEFNKNDFVYADPPYLITTGSYNDGNRGFKNWDQEQEQLLYSKLDELNIKGVKFALSNVVVHKGSINTSLIEWSKQYNVNYLNYCYKNSSYNTSRESSQEVLITNY